MSFGSGVVGGAVGNVVADLLVRVTSDTSGMESGLAGAKAAVTGFGKSMIKGGAALTALVTAPLVAGGFAAINYASDLNEANNTIGKTFGEENRAQIDAWAQAGADSMGLWEGAAKQFATNAGTIGTAAGYVGQDLVDFSTQSVQTAADLGSFYNVDPGQAFEKLRAGLVGEYEPLRSMGILLDEATVSAKAMEMGLVDANGEVTQAGKVQARWALIQEQANAQMGDFADTADSAANAQRRLRAHMQNTAASLGKIMLPAFESALKGLNKFFTAFGKLPEGVLKAVVAFGAFVAAIGPAMMILGAVAVAIGILLSPLGLLAAALVLVATKTNLFQSAWAAIGPVLSAAAGYIRDVWNAGDAMQASLAKLPAVLQPIAFGFGLIVTAVQDVVDAFQDLMDGDIAGFFDELGEAASTAWDGLKMIGEQLLAILQGIDWAGIAQSVWNALKAAFDAIPWGTIWDTLKDWGSILLNKGIEVIGGLVQGLVNAWPTVTAWLGNLGRNIAGAVVGAAEWLSEKGEQAITGLQTAFTDNWPTVSEWLSDMGTEVKTAVGDASDWFDGVAKPAIEGLVDDLGVQVSALTATLKEKFKTFLSEGFQGVSASDIIGGHWSADFGSELGTKFGEAVETVDWIGLGGKALSIQGKIFQGITQVVLAAAALVGVAILNIGALIVGFIEGALESANWGNLQTIIGDKIKNAIQFASDGLAGKLQAVSDKIGTELGNAVTASLDFITGVKRAIQEKLSGLSIDGSTITNGMKNIATSIAAKIAEMIGAWDGSTIKSALTKKLDSLSISGDSILSFGKSIGDAISAAAKRGVEALSGSEIGKAITNKIDSIRAAAEDFVGLPASIANALWAAVKKWVSDNITKDKIWDLISGAASGAADAAMPRMGRDFSADAAKAQQATFGKNDFSALSGGSSALDAVKVAATAAAQAVAAAAQTISTAMSSIASSTRSTATAVAQGWQQMQQAAQQSNTAMGSAVQSNFPRMASTIQTTSSQAQQAASNAFRQMQQAVQQSMQAASQAVTTSTGQIRSAVQQTASAVQTAGTNAGNSWKQGITSGFQQAATAAQNGAQAVRNAANSVGSLYSPGYSVGQSFGQGVYDGLMSMVGMVAAAAATLVATAAGAAQARGEISSPSKLFIREVGKPMALGIAEGMLRGAAQVRAASAAVVDAALVGSGSSGALSNAATAMARPSGDSYFLFTLDPEHYRELLENSYAGGNLAKNFATELRYW